MLTLSNQARKLSKEILDEMVWDSEITLSSRIELLIEAALEEAQKVSVQEILDRKDLWAPIVKQAVAAERDRCAKLVSEYDQEKLPPLYSWDKWLSEIAKAIRGEEA